MRKNKTLLGVSVHAGSGSRVLHEEFNTTTEQIIQELGQNGMVLKSILAQNNQMRYSNQFAEVKKLTSLDKAPVDRILGIIGVTAGLYTPETALVAGMHCPKLPKGQLVNAAMKPLKNGNGDQYLFAFLRINGGCLVYANLASPERDFHGKDLFLYPAGTRLSK